MVQQFSPIKKPVSKPISKVLGGSRNVSGGEFRAKLNTGFRKQMQNAVCDFVVCFFLTLVLCHWPGQVS